MGNWDYINIFFPWKYTKKASFLTLKIIDFWVWSGRENTRCREESAENILKWLIESIYLFWK